MKRAKGRAHESAGYGRSVHLAPSPNLSGVSGNVGSDRVSGIRWSEVDLAGDALSGWLGIENRFRRRRARREISGQLCAISQPNALAVLAGTTIGKRGLEYESPPLRDGAMRADLLD